MSSGGKSVMVKKGKYRRESSLGKIKGKGGYTKEKPEKRGEMEIRAL